MNRGRCVVVLAALTTACSWDWDSRDSRHQDAATGTDAGPLDVPDGGRWAPSSTTSWQIQLTDPISTTVDAQLFEIDLDEDAATITALHAAGRKVVCNFSAGTFESFRHDGAAFPAAVRGNQVAGSSGEFWLDVTDAAVRAAMAARVARAASVGCDAIDPDNVDGSNESTGFAISRAQQVDYDTFLATTAHADGLSIALNEAGALVPMLAGAFDWGRTDNCTRSPAHCGDYATMLALGKAVLDAEYVPASMLASVCASAASMGVDAIIKPSDDGPDRAPCIM